MITVNEFIVTKKVKLYYRFDLRGFDLTPHIHTFTREEYNETRYVFYKENLLE